MEKVGSSDPFEIARDLAIPLNEGAPYDFDDDTYFEYVKRYREWAVIRDKGLAVYLAKTPDLFRCFIPFNNPNTYRICSQVVWYYDEIIIADPMNFLLDDIPAAEIERKLPGNKNILRQCLGLLNYFNIPIRAGYLLLAGRGVLPKLNDPPPEILDYLVRNDELKRVLENAVRFGLEKRYTEKGSVCYVWDANLYSGFAVGFIMPGPVYGGKSAAYLLGETLPVATIEEITALSPVHIDLTDTYKAELRYIVKSALLGSSISAAVLYDRELDAKTLGLVQPRDFDISRQIDAIMPLVLTLPYLENVPPELLQDLRIIMPDSFLVLRSNLVSIIRDAVRKDPENAIRIAQTEIARVVLPELSKLDAEVKAAAKKAKLAALGIPVSIGVGYLFGNVLGVIPSVGALGFAYKAFSDYIATLDLIKANPFYFLWKARRRPVL